MLRPDSASARSYRLALVTGASSGIGQAFAETLPSETGLLLVGRDRERLTALADRLAQPGRTVLPLAADLTTDAGRALVVEQAERQEIDLLINNAGTGMFGRVLDHDGGDERATVELNVVATTVLTHALLPGMLARARSVEGTRAGLILVSSTTAFAPVPYLATYAASKAFDLSFGEALAEELRGEPIDVLTLCPGATRTRFAERSGYGGGQFPGATAPERVAREGLAMLGRRTVHVVGATGLALNPLALTRYALTGGIGAAVRRLARP